MFSAFWWLDLGHVMCSVLKGSYQVCKHFPNDLSLNVVHVCSFSGKKGENVMEKLSCCAAKLKRTYLVFWV